MSDSSKPIVILIGGVSGCGKSTIAEKLMREFKYNWVLVDDIRNAMTVVSDSNSPLRAFSDYTIYNHGYDSQKLADYHRALNNEVCKGLEVIIQDHLNRKIPMILEGDDITPEFMRKMLDSDPRVKGFFISIDNENLKSNILKRAEMNGEKVVGSYWDYINMVLFENTRIEEEVEKFGLKSFKGSEKMIEEVMGYLK